MSKLLTVLVIVPTDHMLFFHMTVFFIFFFLCVAATITTERQDTEHRQAKIRHGTVCEWEGDVGGSEPAASSVQLRCTLGLWVDAYMATDFTQHVERTEQRGR